VFLVRSKALSYVSREFSFRLQLRVELLNGTGILGLLNALRQDDSKQRLATTCPRSSITAAHPSIRYGRLISRDTFWIDADDDLVLKTFFSSPFVVPVCLEMGKFWQLPWLRTWTLLELLGLQVDSRACFAAKRDVELAHECA
jgi:hypothetical protein